MKYENNNGSLFYDNIRRELFMIVDQLEENNLNCKYSCSNNEDCTCSVDAQEAVEVYIFYNFKKKRYSCMACYALKERNFIMVAK